MRGRTAPGGVYRQLCTATAKDTPKWRTARDALKAARQPNGAPVWHVARMEGPTNPFVHPSFWVKMEKTLPRRVYLRVVLAQDVSSEFATYPHWDRGRHLQPIPLIGATDVTAQVLSRWGPNNVVLAGHDPGRLQDVTTFYKAYRLNARAMNQLGLRPSHHIWWCVGELTTPQTTTAQHIEALKPKIREWGCYQLDYKGRVRRDSPRCLFRIDPYGNSDNRTDISVKQWFQRKHLIAINAADRQGINKGRIPKDPGIKMVDRLLGTDRFLVDCNERREPVAPKLVEAFESEQRDPTSGEAETRAKDRKDTSHWPSTARYALWQLERLPIDEDESYEATVNG